MIPFGEFIATDFGKSFCSMFEITNEAEYIAEAEHIHKEMEDEPRVLYMLQGVFKATIEEIDRLL